MGCSFPTLRGNKMMNKLIFVQGFEEKQCLKCLCVLTSSCTPTGFSVSMGKEGDSGSNDTKPLLPLFPSLQSSVKEGMWLWFQYWVNSDSLLNSNEGIQLTGLLFKAISTFWMWTLHPNTPESSSYSQVYTIVPSMLLDLHSSEWHCSPSAKDTADGLRKPFPILIAFSGTNEKKSHRRIEVSIIVSLIKSWLWHSVSRVHREGLMNPHSTSVRGVFVIVVVVLVCLFFLSSSLKLRR